MKNYLFPKKRMFLLVFLFFFSFSLIQITEAKVDTNLVDDVFQVNSVLDYSKPCSFNGTYCSASAQCNYTQKSPGQVVKLNNVLATNLGAFHNYTMNFDELGVWTIEMVCCDGGSCGTETLYAEVTGDGFNDTAGFYFVILFIAVLIIGLGLWKQDPIVTLLGSFALYFLAIYILLNGIVGVRNLTITWGIGIILLGMAAYISVISAWEIINDAGAGF